MAYNNTTTYADVGVNIEFVDDISNLP